MGFDFMKEMQRPKNDVQHLQPWRLYHAKNLMTGEDSKAKGYYRFLENQGQRILTDGRQLLGEFGLGSPQCNSASVLPEFSWVLNLNLTLASAYIAKDDAVFAPTENPLRIEKIFGLPYVSPMAWKGLLRGEMELMGFKKEVLARLFGTAPSEADNTEDAIRGRLCFFPTFFKDTVGLDVINPHTRETKTDASGPISIEVAPRDNKGLLQLVYIPFGKNCDLNTSLDDWQRVAQGLKQLLLEAGISAKRNIGYGLVEDQLNAEKPDSFFQINTEAFLTDFDNEDVKQDDFWTGLLQENGALITRKMFNDTYAKRECKEKFNNSDKKKAYVALERRYQNELAVPEQEVDGLKRFPIKHIKDITGLEIAMEGKTA